MIQSTGSVCQIEIDGGVTTENAKKLIDMGADVLVSGSHVFKSHNPKEIIQKLQNQYKRHRFAVQSVLNK